MFCPNCGRQLPDTAVFCPSCGATMAKSQEPHNEYRQNTYQQHQPHQQHQQHQPHASHTPQNLYRAGKPPLNIMAIVGFIIGCVSVLISFWGIYGTVALVLSLVGLVQINNNGGGGKGLAIAGMVMGAVSVLYVFISALIVDSFFNWALW